MTYDYELTLIQKDVEEDELGNQVEVENNINILCGISSIGRNEYYKAAAKGLKLEMTFTVHEFEYSGEDEVIYDKSRYRVVRTYKKNNEEIELICKKVLSDGEQ